MVEIGIAEERDEYAAPNAVAPEFAARRSRGRDARARAPRSRQGPWHPGVGRADPVALLEGQATTRDPDIVPLRYERMSVSPFAFFRGAALLMASDLATAPRTDITVQLCGDAHLSNFGLFGTPERRLIFDMNDFDETFPGPFEWDLKRLRRASRWPDAIAASRRRRSAPVCAPRSSDTGRRCDALPTRTSSTGTYAEQNDQDFALFRDALASGRLPSMSTTRSTESS